MKIVFFDLIDFDYSVGTVFEAPLGGSQSALSYLAMNLANLGHDIFLINKISAPIVSHGVACLPISCVSNQFWLSVDFIICFNGANSGEMLRKLCGEKTNIILWNQHAHDQPAIQRLSKKEEKESYDYFFFISDWQAEKFIKIFGIEREKVVIFRNAIGYNFEGLFDSKSSILEKKVTPLSLAYTSTPFRGLGLLVDIFPRLREKFSEIKLKIFSSMQVYQLSDENYNSLYTSLRAIEGVQYFGSISQPQLAKELRDISILIYPNIFPETSCIAVMEAMASGCHIITSDLGALPETTAGFATLVPFNPDLEVYKQDFVTATIQYIEDLQSENVDSIEARLAKQIEYCQQNYVWEKRAHEWLIKLYEIRAYTFFKQQEYEIAISFYQEALDDFSGSENFCSYLILSLILFGLEEEALSVIMNAVITSKFNNPDYLSEKLNQVIEKESNFLATANEGQALETITNFFDQLE
ncbi:glycosyltransferase family 4 protein [Synechocystis sp. CACIAM 05]|uniref:glycosyltransferase family 4 protein n=1 Tax=Synechocystis sp. CACIAM 05 TaxID=1933929 RepID=UPI00138E6990|nr:glycosyltransferase family 4 protein [Synechocystis sp. CACIAM 05]QHU99765.1 hypothetical protein BWK47_06195 [Synechocystis sp. CACIAM 05]